MTSSKKALLVCVAILGCSQKNEPPIDVKSVKQVHDFLACTPQPPQDFLSPKKCQWVDEEHREEYKRFEKSLIEYEETIKYIQSLGERAYPTFEAILSDPNSDKLAVRVVLNLIGKNARHSRFRNRFQELAVSRFAEQDYHMRLSILRLTGRIGGPEEAPLVYVCLYDEDEIVVCTAAEVLFEIGGPNEVVAMDVWLRGVSHRDDRQLREHVQKCRDELKKRLDAKKVPKK